LLLDNSMARLCEDCPLRGECVGEIQAAGFATVSVNDQPVTLGEVHDTIGNTSMVFEVDAPTTAIRRFDQCESPREVAKPGPLRRVRLECGAIGVGSVATREQLQEFHKQRMPTPMLRHALDVEGFGTNRYKRK
jgi:hypothetical protein